MTKGRFFCHLRRDDKGNEFGEGIFKSLLLSSGEARNSGNEEQLRRNMGAPAAGNADGYCGAISRNANVQAYPTLRVLRNAPDDVDIMTGSAFRKQQG